MTYEDEPKSALPGGVLESRIKQLGFTSLVCLSGWSDAVQMPPRPVSQHDQKEMIHQLIAEIFPDKAWFIDLLTLTTDTDNRCRQIRLDIDWWYVDDWADKYFTEAFGKDLYEAALGKRICLADPYGDRRDILNWLDSKRKEGGDHDPAMV